MWYFRSLHAHVARELVRMRSGGGDVLDAGCGTGGLILRLREANPAWRFAGIDFMPLACELARRRCGEGTDIREASITALPYADASFDAVVLITTLGEIPDRESAIHEIARVVRPGGRLVVGELFGDPHFTTPGDVERLGRASGLLLEQRSGPWVGFFARLSKPTGDDGPAG